MSAPLLCVFPACGGVLWLLSVGELLLFSQFCNQPQTKGLFLFSFSLFISLQHYEPLISSLCQCWLFRSLSIVLFRKQPERQGEKCKSRNFSLNLSNGDIEACFPSISAFPSVLFFFFFQFCQTKALQCSLAFIILIARSDNMMWF